MQILADRHFAVSVKVKMLQFSLDVTRSLSGKALLSCVGIEQISYSISMCVLLRWPILTCQLELSYTYDCCTAHNSDLEHYYNCIVDCLLSASSSCVPQVCAGPTM